ncbi:hypothetical protein P3T73_16385 [Kiritimatiellota bacterium B12222]|nr:hypothetical protein P3T73_16385 [Kiritimatiellota bacterium B12222]
MKRVVLLVDAAADLPTPELKDGTPLMQARQPSARRLAEEGSCGALRRIRPDADASRALLAECCGLSDPQARSIHWGPMAAASLNLPLDGERSYFLAGFVSLDAEEQQDQVQPSSMEEQAQLLTDLQRELGIRFHSLYLGRFLMEIPGQVISKLPSKVQYQRSGFLKPLPPILRNILDKTEIFLESHPVNQVRVDLGEPPIHGLWCWSGGTQGVERERPPFRQAMVSPEPISKGMAQLWGMSYLEMENPYGLDRPDAAFDVSEMIQLIENHDEVIIWLPASSEGGRFEGSSEKVRRLDAVDYYVTGPVKAILEEMTPSRLLLIAAGVRHHGRPERGAAPFVLWGDGVLADDCRAWTEIDSLQGSLGTPRLLQLLEIFRKEI